MASLPSPILRFDIKKTSIGFPRRADNHARPVSLPMWPHPLAGTTLPRFGRLARASAPLLMQIQDKIFIDGSRGPLVERKPEFLIRHGPDFFLPVMNVGICHGCTVCLARRPSTFALVSLTASCGPMGIIFSVLPSDEAPSPLSKT